MSKNTQAQQVAFFNSEADQPVSVVFSPELFSFRMSLISEEFKEFAEAAANLMVERDGPEEETRINMEHLLKELCDCIYVLNGIAVTFAWDVDEAFKRVHESNMTKLPFSKTDDGKVMKGPNYEPCDLGGLV